MKLLGTHTSPYTRKVRLTLLEKNIPHEYLVDPPREPGSQVARVNPLGRIPALILDDETCVLDSPVIAEYADTLNDTPILIPRTDALARMRVRRWRTASWIRLSWYAPKVCARQTNRKPAPSACTIMPSRAH